MNNEDKIKVTYVVNKPLWSNLNKYVEEHNNIELKLYENRADYLVDEAKKYITDSDIILIYTSGFDSFKYEKAKDIAINISNIKDKRVSIGYAHITSNKKNDFKYGIRFTSIKDNDIYEYDIDDISLLPPVELLNITLNNHNELLNQKIKKYK